MKVLAFIDWFKSTNGATSAVLSILKELEREGIEGKLVCEYNSSPLPSNASIWNEHNVKEYLHADNVVAFYFLTGVGKKGGALFDRVSNVRAKANHKVPLITVVLQKPSNPSSILTPKIIKKSSHLVFIDKAAYGNKIYSFIPEDRKSMLYMSWPSEEWSIYFKQLYESKEVHDKNKQFVYGRGSSISKCPKDIIELFERINVESKRFVICGINDDTWLAAKAKKYENVVTIPNQDYKCWTKECSKFDVFLYYVPKSAYSSLDGNLGVAMRLGIPPIVYGPEVYKERVIHGYNGFVAETKDQIVEYAELLYKDDNLRRNLGENARKSIENFRNNSETTDKLVALCEKLLQDNECGQIVVPWRLKFKCRIIKTTYCVRTNISAVTRGLFLMVKDPSLFIKKIKMRRG